MKRKIASAIATLSLLLYSFAIPVFAQTTTLGISGNGSDSDNEVKAETKTETTVVQSNNANIENKIEAEANTGDNKAKDNTGGNTTIDTGNATTRVDVSNQANANTADVNCPTCLGSVDATISGNGSDSKNEIKTEQKNKTEVYQTNNADIENDIEAKANTGDNEVEDNTGGNSEVRTGDAQASVTIGNLANANAASIGGGNNQGSISALITGNGSDSKNKIDLEHEQSILLVQDNNADIENDIEAKANTGDNEVEDNTGGDVTVDTGNATTDVTVDNAVNFNWADISCCIFDVLAKISGNGSDSENKIEAEFENELQAFQNNCGKDGISTGPQGLFMDGRGKCELENKIEAESETGNNDPEGNTGPIANDPVEVTTGDAEDGVTVDNSANVNIFGRNADDSSSMGLDNLLDGLGLHFSFNLQALLALLQSLNIG